MRAVLLATIIAAMPLPCAAQDHATLQVLASVDVPTFLSARVGESRDTVNAAGAKVRQVAVQITANCRWSLQVWRGTAPIDVTTGGSGNRVVVVELPWREAGRPPDPAELKYLLVAV